MNKNSKKRSYDHLLGRIGLIVWSVALVAALVLITLYARVVLPSGQMAAVITSALVDLTNKDRDTQNLETLTVNPALVAAAQAKADDMAAKGYFAHNSPDGKTSWYWLKQAGYRFSHAGENLAVNFSDSIDVERAWMKSPTHRANILNGKFTEIGIATAVGEYKGKETIFVVQMFGSPATPTTVTNVVREIVPEDPREIAIASAEPEQSPSVLGSETFAAAPAEGEAATVTAPDRNEPPTPTSTGEPASVSNPTNTIEENTIEAIETTALAAPSIEAAASSPKALIRTFYLLMGAGLLVVLVLITGIEWRRHHMRHVFAFSVLLVLMSGLLLVADRYLFPTPIVGQEIGQ